LTASVARELASMSSLFMRKVGAKMVGVGRKIKGDYIRFPDKQIIRIVVSWQVMSYGKIIIFSA
jgi:hypothetical protein